jgi:hypothetical protein
VAIAALFKSDQFRFPVDRGATVAQPFDEEPLVLVMFAGGGRLGVRTALR